MAGTVNRDYSNDILLRVSPKNNTIMVEEQKPGGVTSFKEISPIELYYAINGSYRTADLLSSGLLPEHCLSISMSSTEKRIVLWNPELRADMSYGGVDYPDFPLPRLVFDIRMLENGKVVDCSMGVVADEPPTPDTQMYYYPFSNVYSDGRVCTGNNVLPRYQKLTALKHFPRYLLEIPDNDDMFRRECNQKCMNHREIMEHLKDKDPAYYYTDILVSNGKKLKDFISGR
jgi:hypothetical protein